MRLADIEQFDVFVVVFRTQRIGQYRVEHNLSANGFTYAPYGKE